MRNILLLLALSGLVACTAANEKTACAADAAYQPLAAGVASAIAPATGSAATGVEAGVALDASVVHPAVQAACAALLKAPVAPVK